MKDELRKKFKAARNGFSGREREEADEKIARNFMAEYGFGGSYLIYNAIGSEAQTKIIIGALISANKRVYLPRVEGKNIVAAPYGKTRLGAFGVYEPVGESYSGEIDVTVAPLLAINSRGYRLGYGGGFYDRYLKGKNTAKVGLGYAFQLTDEFIENVWDEPLDAFVSERGICRFGI